jgi:hypothetical protein
MVKWGSYKELGMLMATQCSSIHTLSMGDLGRSEQNSARPLKTAVQIFSDTLLHKLEFGVLPFLHV